ncbi:transcription initiation factor TFIID subunit 1 [Pseudohyphozyma bogoriensis]|nr:transcription initiation factor TFIID subunit 1 [Pseudohyphozyma bogoriensis]
MADADSVLNQLGGFALGEVLSSLALDEDTISGGLGQLGISSTSAFSRDSIYKGKFVDEEEGDDLEDEVDREMEDEMYRGKSAAGAGAGTGAGLVRGEEEDFDDDDEEEADGGATEIKVKEEPKDDDEGLFGDNASPEEERMDVEVDPSAQEPPKTVDVKDLFPTFQYGKVLDFTDLFATRPRKKAKTEWEAVHVTLPTQEEFPKSRSTKDILVAPLKPTTRDGRMRELLAEEGEGEGEEREAGVDSDDELLGMIENANRTSKSKWVLPSTEAASTFSQAELDSWEDRVIWNPNDSSLTLQQLYEPLAPRNAAFANGEWTKSIIWDPSTRYDPSFTTLNLNLNDPMMLLEVQNDPTEVTPSLLLPASVVREEGLDPFNLSNDKEYEVNKEFKKTVRQTLSSLEVQHAWPAAKLQLPFYKTRLSKADTRAFHRPPLQFPVNIQLGFAKVKGAKKKKDKTGKKIRKSDGESLRRTSDITCRDTSQFVLWEFSEENPPIISNLGMGSIIVNYYRKKSDDDDFIPQADLGEPFLLDMTDESPFKAFGYVYPGQTVPTLYNNLIRAPLFRHKPYPTDFLLVRSTIDGDTKYYIRELKTIFVVGQTYPINEVPGPHSRKISTLVKNRLQTIAFKLVEKNPHNRIKVNKLTRYFPDQNDLQMRQRLKEFMEFNRKGPDQGFWMIKKTIKVPDRDEMLKMATPEMVCLAESMQVGLRHLQDAGYGKAEEGGAGDDDSKLDIEQQLAPWITTKNFINATANKAMLKLHGDGDPTGRGEAFSFLRVSMKDIFLRAGEDMATRLAQMENRPKSAHKYNVQEQQEIYKEEIARIWKVQADSLSDPVPPELTQEDEDRQRGARRRGGSTVADTPHSTVGTPFGRAGTPGSRASSPDRDDGMSQMSGKPGDGQHKILRVKRLVAGKWETEIVRDPSVIAAYVRQRQVIDDEKTDADDLLPSDDEGKNQRRMLRLKEQLEKLKRNQERRLARKNQKLGIAPGAIGVGGKKAMKPETTRICGNCGQRGHMKTSKRLCPRWHEFNAPKESSTTGALPSFGGGLALPSMNVATPKAAPASSPPKAAFKIKIGGSAMSPPADSPAS